MLDEPRTEAMNLGPRSCEGWQDWQSLHETHLHSGGGVASKGKAGVGRALSLLADVKWAAFGGMVNEMASHSPPPCFQPPCLRRGLLLPRLQLPSYESFLGARTLPQLIKDCMCYSLLFLLLCLHGDPGA